YMLHCWIIEGESYPYLVGESRVRVCSYDGLIPIIRQVFQYKEAMEPVREAPTWGKEPYRKYRWKRRWSCSALSRCDQRPWFLFSKCGKLDRLVSVAV
ncbi:hypothetical protein Tco_0826340, partial [Tanacetum coccineum]